MRVRGIHALRIVDDRKRESVRRGAKLVFATLQTHNILYGAGFASLENIGVISIIYSMSSEVSCR